MFTQCPQVIPIPEWCPENDKHTLYVILSLLSSEQGHAHSAGVWAAHPLWGPHTALKTLKKSAPAQ